MSKSRAVAQNQMRSKGGRRLRRRSLWIYLLVGGLALAVAVGLLVYFNQSREPSPATDLPNSAAPLSIASVGKSAPGFMLNDSDGDTYTLTPGDGRAHVLVFYMGNF